MHPNPDAPRRAINTSFGMLSILFWSTTVGVSRLVMESLGTLTGAATIYAAGAVGSLVYLAVRPATLRSMLRLPRRYLLGCGSMFAAYVGLLYWAIGHAASEAQAVEIGLVNYLWPSFTLLLSVPVLGRRARAWIWPGMAMALAGVVLAEIQPGRFSLAELWSRLASNPAPYACALAGAVLWGLYSNFSRRWAGHQDGGAVQLFIVATALCLLAMRLTVSEPSPHWSPWAIAGAIYMGLFPGLVSYLFWDIAVRRGHITVIASLSYMIPLLATLISCLFLGVPMRSTLWLACGLLICGAWLCQRSIHERSISG